METGEHQLGFVTLGPADEARRGESPLMPGTPHENVRALFPMYQTPLQAAVLASSDIESFQDLQRKRVGVGPAGGTSATYWTRFFENAEGYGDVTISNAGGSDTAGQLKDGLIDAFVYAACPGPQLFDRHGRVMLRPRPCRLSIHISSGSDP